jgi:hypothetical protein
VRAQADPTSPVDDHPFAEKIAVKLIDPLPCFDHEVRDLGANPYCRYPARGTRLDETNRVQMIARRPTGVLCDCGSIQPADSRLRVRRRMRAATARHLVKTGHVSAKRVEVGETGQRVHEFHGPHPDAFEHDEPDQEA